tara:strand:+ start:1213 stop:1791 length:579 start_codon:yes stop_codon:yes gene_type:complete
MKAKEIFPTHLYGESFIDFDSNYIEKLLASIELLRRGDINGRAISNYNFGWQSQNMPTEEGVFKNLLKKIEQEAFLFCESIENFSFINVKMDNLWANINYENDINWPHKHGGDISGVYYLDVNENCGDLSLSTFNYSENIPLQKHLRSKYNKLIKPENKKLILFDSDCVHAVLKNFSGKPRISLSFNLKIYA